MSICIVESDDSFEVHIKSSVTNNIVNGYNYKRLVIPGLLMDYFKTRKSDVKYLFLYFFGSRVFISVDKIPGLKYSRRKVMRVNNKNSFFIYLNGNSFKKYNINVADSVLFKVCYGSLLNSAESVNIELLFS